MKRKPLPHDILVTFTSGRQVKYTTNILQGPHGLLADPEVIEIVDLDTGEVIFSDK